MEWLHTDDDISTQILLKLGFEQSKAIQEFQTIALVLSKMFGSSSSNKGSAPVQTEEEALARFAAVFK